MRDREIKHALGEEYPKALDEAAREALKNRLDKLAGALTGFFFWMICLFSLVGLFWFASCAWRSATAEDRIYPEDLEYLGSFKVPGWRRDDPNTPDRNEGHERFGYGMDALAYNPSRGTLFATGHPHGALVGEITIPTPRREDVQRALLVQQFGDVRGRLRDRVQKNGLDRFGGMEIVDGKLYWSFYRYYAVQSFARIDVASIGRSSLDLQRPQAEGLWKVGPYGSRVFSQKRTSKYMTSIPAEWSASYSPGRRLAVGKGDGPGSSGNSQGPSLFAVAIPETAADGAVLDAQLLVHYPPGTFPDWSACDEWTGVTWIGGEKSAVLFSGVRGTGEDDYGTPQEVSSRRNRTSCRGGKGYHCDPYRVEILFYDPIDLARSAQGEMPPHEVMPYAAMHPEFPDHHCAKALGAIAFNPENRELYLVQGNKENPIVHVWKVNRGTAPLPKGDDPVITLMDVKLEALTSLMTALLLEGATPEDLVAALEMAKLKKEDYKNDESFESIDAEGE